MTDDRTPKEAGPEQVAAAAIGVIITSMIADGEAELSRELAGALKAKDWPRMLAIVMPLYENLARLNRGPPH